MSDDEVSLPKATIQNLIKKHLPPDLRLSNDAVEMLYKCCNEFVQALYSEANEISTKDNKSTITPEHVTQAMEELGFEEFLDGVKAAHEQWKVEQQQHAQKHNRKTGAEAAGMTEEEQIALQQQMFAAAAAQAGMDTS